MTLKGRSVYVGDTLSLFNPIPTWFGEGDEKIWIDGESFPSHLGTGTEDHYGYSYAPRRVIQTPFANQVRVDQEMTQGHNVLTRARNLDGIPFRNSLKFDMELMAWAPTTLIYAATTYWYAFSGLASNVEPQPTEAANPVPTLADTQSARLRRIHGAIDCETLKKLAKSEGVPAESQDMGHWDRNQWSQGTHLVVKPTQVGQFVELEVPVPGSDAQARRLTVYLTNAPDFGILKFTVNGNVAEKTIDSWADQVQPADPVAGGAFTPEEGRFRVRIEVTGANFKSIGPKIFFGLDCFALELIP